MLRGSGVKRGPSESPAKGTSDGPSAAYPHPRLSGRGDHGLVLPHRRHLHTAQPEREALRTSQAALGLGGVDPGAFPATPGHRERAVLPARCPEVLLTPVPWGGGAAPFLVPSADEEAQTIPGTPAPRHPPRDGREPGDIARRLDSSTRLCFRFCTPGRFLRARVSPEARG